MPPPNPAENLDKAPTADLIVLLLKQFKPLLVRQGIALNTAEERALAELAAGHHPLPENGAKICAALISLIEESLALLRERWNFSYAESLRAEMESIGGWETTAEFLEIANEKSNAELRISGGSSLLALLGERRFANFLLDVLAQDGGVNDIDAVFARRALLHLTQVDSAAPDWLNQVRRWLEDDAAGG